MNPSTNETSLGRFFWLACLALGAILAYVVMFVMPHEIYIHNPWVPIGKIATFVLVILGIAFFPQDTRLRRYTHLLLMAAIFTFLVYFIPRVSYYGFVGIPKNEPNCYDEFYTQLWLFLYPAIILTTCFGFRLMGGTSGQVIKLAVVPVIGLFSGLLDIIWPITNRMPLPDKLLANHIRIIIGHWPTYREGVVFTLCHIPLVLVVLALPLDRWFGRVSFLKAASNEPAPDSKLEAA